MQGDPLHAVEGVISSLGARTRAVAEAATRTRALRDRLTDDLTAKQGEIDELAQRAERLAKVGELFRALMDKLVEEQKTVVEGLVTEGLRAIFPDQELTFEAEVVQRANRVEIDLFFREGSDALAVRDHPLAGFGGGTTSICSLILRVLAVRRLNRYPFLILDESLPAVSDEYVEYSGRFLQRLCSTMGIDLLLVTHIPGFLSHADMAYEGHKEALDEGPGRLQLRRVRGRA
jgi:hypothetical protein